jgi:hypothetical protein
MAISLVDVENLANYTEGTFTPVLSDASSGGNVSSTSAAEANYTKIGRVVFIQVRFSNINTSGMTAANELIMQGLPFTSAASNNIPTSIWMQSVTGLETDVLSLVARIVTGSTTVRFEEMTKSGTDSAFNINDISSGATDFEIAGFYFT